MQRFNRSREILQGDQFADLAWIIDALIKGYECQEIDSIYEILHTDILIYSQNEAGGTGNTSTQMHDNKIVHDGMKE